MNTHLCQQDGNEAALRPAARQEGILAREASTLMLHDAQEDPQRGVAAANIALSGTRGPLDFGFQGLMLSAGPQVYYWQSDMP